jgi:hypothetical protein
LRKVPEQVTQLQLRLLSAEQTILGRLHKIIELLLCARPAILVPKSFRY